jgi:hypothetical protein
MELESIGWVRGWFRYWKAAITGNLLARPVQGTDLWIIYTINGKNREVTVHRIVDREPPRTWTEQS